MWTRAELKEKAKIDLKKGYWPLVVMSLIMAFLTGGSGGSGGSGSSSGTGDSSGGTAGGFGGIDSETLSALMVVLGLVLVILVIAIIIGLLIGIFVYNPLVVGAHRYFVLATYKEAEFSDFKCLGHGFKKGNYLNVVKCLFLMGLYQFLWTLLFIIPGIIKSYEYRMIPYILAENPNLDAKDVFRLSKEMMDGEKMDAWVLDISFIGWAILSVFTCGILAIFYVNPYIYMTDAHLYEALKHRASMDYYDHSLGAQPSNMYGNPGAYAQNAPTGNPYDDPYQMP